MATSGAPVENASEFANTPKGLQQRWQIEIATQRENLREFRKRGQEAVKRFLGEHRPTETRGLNLFHSDVKVVRSMLYAKLPSVDVSRRFNDPDDDIGRVTAEMEERLLNTDIDRDDDGFKSALKYALEDWTLPGLGVARIRYDAEFEAVPGKPAITRPDPETGEETEVAPAVPEGEKVSDEDVETIYVHWEDFLFGPGKTWHDVQWVDFGTPMTEEPFTQRFGKKAWRKAPKKSSETGPDGKALSDDVKKAWAEVYVHEIWDKATRKVIWLVEGAGEVLDVEDDPLGLIEFFPCPKPLMRNVVTGKVEPRPDHEIAKNQYDLVEDMDVRLRRLIWYARVRGAYDKANAPELGRIFDAGEGDMIGVEKWLNLLEKGGLDAAMAFLPLDAVVKAIEVLSVKRAEAISLLRQITGVPDILRGQATQKATATEQSIKAQAAGTRIEEDQNELARFASDLQRLRAECIAKWYEPETIIERSNIMRTKDAPKAKEAAALLKDRYADYRIQVRPESMAMQDMATVRQERAEALMALGQHFTAMTPLVQMAIPAGPQAIQATMQLVTRLGQWMVAGLRGASQAEQAFDDYAQAVQKLAAQAAAQPPAPPPPDPKVEAAKIDLQTKQMEAGAKREQVAMESQVARQQHAMDMQKMQADTVKRQIDAKTEVAKAAAMPTQPEPFKRMPGMEGM